MTSLNRLVIGTRGSPLALAQARLVQQALCRAHPGRVTAERAEIRTIRTSGDKIQDRTLAEAGGKGLFTKEIDEALQNGEIDLAVHSMKDVPTHLPAGIVLPAMLERADPRDALISNDGRSLAELPAGIRVGTASLRRGAQLLAKRPDLKVVPLRGNVETRLAKLRQGEVGATFLAMAGLIRLGLEHVVTAPLTPEEMLPAPAQGAVGITCREGDARILDLLHPIDHGATHTRILAERAMLRELDGSCRTPIAALAELEGATMRLEGLVATPDGSAVARADAQGGVDDPEALGTRLGRELRLRMGGAWDSGR